MTVHLHDGGPWVRRTNTKGEPLTGTRCGRVVHADDVAISLRDVTCRSCLRVSRKLKEAGR